MFNPIIFFNNWHMHPVFYHWCWDNAMKMHCCENINSDLLIFMPESSVVLACVSHVIVVPKFVRFTRFTLEMLPNVNLDNIGKSYPDLHWITFLRQIVLNSHWKLRFINGIMSVTLTLHVVLKQHNFSVTMKIVSKLLTCKCFGSCESC